MTEMDISLGGPTEIAHVSACVILISPGRPEQCQAAANVFVPRDRHADETIDARVNGPKSLFVPGMGRGSRWRPGRIRRRAPGSRLPRPPAAANGVDQLFSQTGAATCHAEGQPCRLANMGERGAGPVRIDTRRQIS